MLYRAVRAFVRFLLTVFYQVDFHGKPLEDRGPVIFVANHPNALIDPGWVFVLTERQVTFLAKAPLFRIPVLAALLRGLGALPVYRRQDDPTQMSKNDGTLEAAAAALLEGRAIMLFPEGRSHSEPRLGELRTGCARIALMAATRGAAVRIVPVGFTYAEKHLFRSRVLIEVGDPLDVRPPRSELETAGASEARELTSRINAALERVTLNLERWEDREVLTLADALYAIRQKEALANPARLRAFAKGLSLLRHEQPERFARLHAELRALQRQLTLVGSTPKDLELTYRPGAVTRFALRNLATLALGLPLYAVGVLAFGMPYPLPGALARLLRAEPDMQATVKVLAMLLVGGAWGALLAYLGYRFLGVEAAVAVFAVSLPLALYTLYFHEHRLSVSRDVRLFFVLGSRARLKQRLLTRSRQLGARVEAVVEELRPRVLEAEREGA